MATAIGSLSGLPHMVWGTGWERSTQFLRSLMSPSFGGLARGSCQTEDGKDKDEDGKDEDGKDEDGKDGKDRIKCSYR
jgi:hypothetical protein